jgi:predicted ATPase
MLCTLAEAHLKTGQIPEGLITLAEALDRVNNTGERWHEAELYRLKGALLLAQASKEHGAKIRRSRS